MGVGFIKMINLCGSQAKNIGMQEECEDLKWETVILYAKNKNKPNK